MAKRKTITGVRDILDGQPAIVLANGHLATFDNVRKTYVDTGIKAVADDDPSAVKYFKLSNESVVPSAPNRQSGWATLNDLNAALSAAGWSENPVSTSADNRYCFMAVYGKSNVHDAAASAAKGTNVFREKFTLSAVVLWSNYANSPVISVEGDRLVITNPDGSRVEQQFATSESADALLKLIQGLQKQVDRAIYSYNGEGAPSMSGFPTTSWLFDSEGQPITNPGTIADIYSTHVGDTYTDIKTFVSYSFILKPGTSSSEPGSYIWEEIKNSALTKALAEISKLGREKLTIHTEKPVTGYKKGDIWLKDENTRLWAIRDNTSFSEADWANPYVSRTDYEAFKEEYAELLTHFRTAQGNITDILNAMKGLDSSVSEAFRDTIITEAERRDLSELSKKLDIEQAQLQSNVNYILDNEFLPSDLKSELTTKSKKLLAASTGSIDKLQESIATAIADNKITGQERADYNAKYNTYVADVKALTDCIDKCRQAIDKKIKDAAIDGVQVGGRNLLTLEHLKRVKLYVGESDNPRYYFQGSWAGMYNANVLPGGTSNNHFLVTDNEITFEEGAQYTFSLEYLSDETSTGKDIGSLIFYYKDGSSNLFGRILTNPTGSGKRAGKIVGTSNPLKALQAIGGLYNVGGKALMNIQLEKGNKPTSIQPAPEDFEARLNAVKAIKMPEIDPVTKNWKLWDDEQKKLVDSGLSSKGDNGNSPYISERTKTWWEYDAENPTAQVEGEKRGYKDTGIKVDGVAVRSNLMKENVLSASDSQYCTVELLPDKYLGSRVILVKGKKSTYPTSLGRYITTEDNEILVFSFYYKHRSAEPYSISATFQLHDYSNSQGYGYSIIPKSIEWKRMSKKVVIPKKGTSLSFLVYYPYNNDGIASDATTIYYAAPKIERILSGEPEIPTAYIPHVENLKGETGKDGMPALSESISVQGEFKTRYKIVDDAGKPYAEPVPVRYIEGGVRVGSKDYVQAKVVISLGATDVTAKALANGANLIWRVNGQQVASNVDTVNLGIEYADGISDKIEVEYEDSNAENWL